MTDRAESLTGVLSAVAAHPIAPEALARTRERLIEGIGDVVGGLAPGDLVEVTLPLLRRTLTHPEQVGMSEPPFAWKPAFARRSLGLAVVRACAEGRFRAPAEAVGPIADQAVNEWKQTGWRTFYWEPWYAGLGSGGRAMVLAEATTWATALWASFDWASLGPRAVFGGTDDQWTCPAPRTVRLKGRSEVRVRLDPLCLLAGEGVSLSSGGQSGGSALVSVAGGLPGDEWREELAYLALVAGLRSLDHPVPARVLGLWPDAGVQRMVEVDEALLIAAVDRVVGAVTTTVEGRPARDTAVTEAAVAATMA